MHRSGSSDMPAAAAISRASDANAGGNGGAGRSSKSDRVGSYWYVLPFQCRPRHSMRTCILPPSRRPPAHGTPRSPDAGARSTDTAEGARRMARVPRFYVNISRPMSPRALPVLVLILCGLCVAMPAPADAHPVPFSYLDLRVERDAIEGTLVVHIFDAGHDLNVEPADRLL